MISLSGVLIIEKYLIINEIEKCAFFLPLKMTSIRPCKKKIQFIATKITHLS